MSRLYFLQDRRGDRQVAETALPLQVGGEEPADLVVPGLQPGTVAAYIALADGHPYLQPADEAVSLFHNHERVTGSCWLKSGDRVQIGDAGMLLWQVKGDQVFVTIDRFVPPTVPPPTPPVDSKLPAVNLPGSTVPASPPERTGIRRGVLGLMALLALVAVFLLVAVPVSIEVEPTPDAQAVHGLVPGISLAGRVLLLPGEYRLEARLEGHHDLDQALEVGRDGPREFHYRMEELPGRVAVRVEPTVSYTLRVDGVIVAADTDGSHPIERGRHLLRIETERHLPAETEIDVTGFDQSQVVVFTLRPAWAELRLGSRPQGATVELDGASLGMTPLTVEVMQGTHRLVLSLPAHKSVQFDLPVEAGTVLRLEEVVLPPADGFLELASTPQGATVTVDGIYRGTTPLRLPLVPGETHRLQLALAGYKPVEKAVEVGPEQTLEMTLKLPAALGTVFVSARPTDAELLIDGKSVGRATQRLRLSARQHTFEFRKEGYASQKLKVTPNPAASQRIDVTLKTVAQAQEAATPATVSAAGGMQLRLVRPGAAPFRMGASRREAGRRANESARLVQLTRPFYLGVTEVTNAQFQRFNAAHNSGSAEGARLDGADLPVVRVDWNEAARYCNWLSRKQGLPEAYVVQGDRMVVVMPMNTGYRLPTEAEWAYVARIHGRSSSARYPWDGGYPPMVVAGNYADARIRDTLADTVPNYDDGHRGAAPIGSFAPQPDGFLDLGGNVAEWIHDYYAVYPGEAERLVTDPTGPTNGDHHVVRGASWRFGSVTELRLSFRDYSRKGRDDLGFRVARYAR